MSYSTSPRDTVRLRSRPALDLRQDGSEIDLTDATLRLEARQLESRHPAILASEEVRWSEYATVPLEQQRWSNAGLRLFDLILAIAGLVLLAPVMMVVALAVRLDSPGPVLYGSPRIGRHKSEFRAWKFRSMRQDADLHLAAVLQSNSEARAEYERYHKLRDDPRLTRVGSFIRRTSLDELPQLVNILLGDMRVVGPRPKLTKDAEAFGAAMDVVLQVKPGLTGLWQVSGRNRLPVTDHIILDLDYARNRTFKGDLYICFKTFLQLWRPGKHGAY